ncbi:MAG: hypothetical protein B6245_10825 [Desulfobacteraceae bacterium 4572_88]|nr:MAG: hypothetical protein B6245_10825 [Desulfobacteraceae bacterium 4572_88]
MEDAGLHPVRSAKLCFVGPSVPEDKAKPCTPSVRIIMGFQHGCPFIIRPPVQEGGDQNRGAFA